MRLEGATGPGPINWQAQSTQPTGWNWSDCSASCASLSETRQYHNGSYLTLHGNQRLTAPMHGWKIQGKWKRKQRKQRKGGERDKVQERNAKQNWSHQGSPAWDDATARTKKQAFPPKIVLARCPFECRFFFPFFFSFLDSAFLKLSSNPWWKNEKFAMQTPLPCQLGI